MRQRLHVISIQNPFPPTYGGVIDIYYRLKALHQAGWGVTLHTYAYKGRDMIDNTLLDIVDDVHVYARRGGMANQLTAKPYIVYSRRDPELLRNLKADDSPILFEGLHNCYFLNHPDLAHRLRIVRTHNVEHDYYRHLSRATTSAFKRFYYWLEADRLRRYEKVLAKADIVAAISPGDLAYFSAAYPEVQTFHLPCFYDDSPPKKMRRFPFVLYHANLSVEENETAALWIAGNVAARLPRVKFVIAGANPTPRLIESLKGAQNIELRPNLPSPEMSRLIASAQVAFFVTFQPTGIKLKLLSSLHKGAHVVVNSKMVEGTTLGDCCDVADDPAELAALISRRLTEPFEGRTLPAIYRNDSSILQLTSRILAHHKMR